MGRTKRKLTQEEIKKFQDLPYSSIKSISFSEGYTYYDSDGYNAFEYNAPLFLVYAIPYMGEEECDESHPTKTLSNEKLKEFLDKWTKMTKQEHIESAKKQGYDPKISWYKLVDFDAITDYQNNSFYKLFKLLADLGFELWTY